MQEKLALQQAIRHLRNCDPVLAAIIDRVGPFTPREGAPTFEALARSIVFQQLNGSAALTIWNRLAEKAGSVETEFTEVDGIGPTR